MFVDKRLIRSRQLKCKSRLGYGGIIGGLKRCLGLYPVRHNSETVGFQHVPYGFQTQWSCRCNVVCLRIVGSKQGTRLAKS